jgi:hypothetical protein
MRETPVKIKHNLLTLVRQRFFGLALGYKYNNDATWLSQGPDLKIMAGKAPESAGDLASQLTLSRFENQVGLRDLSRLSDWLLDLLKNRLIQTGFYQGVDGELQGPGHQLIFQGNRQGLCR